MKKTIAIFVLAAALALGAPVVASCAPTSTVAHAAVTSAQFHNPSIYRVGFRWQAWDKLCGWKGPKRFSRSQAVFDSGRHMMQD